MSTELRRTEGILKPGDKCRQMVYETPEVSHFNGSPLDSMVYLAHFLSASFTDIVAGEIQFGL
jgi:hypothetical protein